MWATALAFEGKAPGHLGQQRRAGGRTDSLGAGGGAGLDSLGNALQDGRDAKQVVGHVEVPVGLERFGCGKPGALAIAAYVLGFRRYAQAFDVQPAYAAKSPGRDVPGHAVIAEVGQRVAQRGQLPVQHGQYARLGGVEQQVVEPEVAMHDGDQAFVARAGRDVGGQPLHQAVHLGDGLGDGGGVLFAPAAYLAFKVVAGFAVVGQAAFGELHLVQCGDHAVHFVVNLAALRFAHAGQGLVPEHAAFDKLHHIKGAAYHGLVFAEAIHLRHRHIGALQALHDLELALHRMGRRQQLRHGARLGAHHIRGRGREQLVGRVGLATLEDFRSQRALEAGQVLAQVSGERVEVKRVSAGYGPGADKVVEVAHA